MTLAARGLAYGFPGRTLGRGIDLELRPGEVTCLLGPNGSGKTTLLRTLLGLLPPIAGEVILEGRALAAWPSRQRAQRLAYVPQAAESYFDFSLRETVQLGRTAHRGVFSAPTALDRERTEEALGRLRLRELAGRPIHRVSGGERQLALIARALATESRYLLMDEPTANLDFANQALILEEVARIRASGHAVLFSTHHPDHALAIADRAVLLKAGGVAAAGTVDDVVDSRQLSALYGRAIEVVDAALADGTRRRTCVATGAALP